jgi:hypothetical protein
MMPVSTLSVNALEIWAHAGQSEIHYIYPGTIDVELGAGIRFQTRHESKAVELGTFLGPDEVSADTWMDDALWKWQNKAADRRAQVWVKHVMVADLLGRPQGYEFDGELVLVGTALPSRQVELLLLQSGFRPSLATWRAKASDERRRRLPEFVARLSEGPSEGRGLGPQEPAASKQVSDIKELKDRAQHVWMRWYALFRDELATAGRTYQMRGRPTLGERELVLRYRHPSSGAELMLRFDVSTHTLHHRTTAAFGGQTMLREALAWEEYPEFVTAVGEAIKPRKVPRKNVAARPVRASSVPLAAPNRHVAGRPPLAMASADRARDSAPRRPTRGQMDWDAIAAESERRVNEKESGLVATMDRLTRIYSGGRLAGTRVRPGTIVVERVSGTPEFPSLVLPNLASIADGIDVGAAVAIVGLMPLEIALAGWVDPGGSPTPEGDRLTAALEESVAAYGAGQATQEEFEANRDAIWEEAERAGVAVEIAWRLRRMTGPTPREPAVATSLPPVPVRAMPQVRYLLELHLRQIPSDAFASVVSRWIRPPHDHLEVGQGAWQRVLELLQNHSTCSQCPFVLGSNLDCDTCRSWVLSLKRPGAPWAAEQIGAALYNCDDPAVATAAVEALAQSNQAPLTAAFFQDFADNLEARLPEDMDPGYRDHCRKAVEWLLPQPDFPLPEYPPRRGAPRSAANLDVLMRAAPMSARWRY